jgi:hypothetical protein
MLSASLDNGQSSETPVKRVIRVFGAARASAIAELTTGAVLKWNRRLSTGGQGGLVPSRYQHRYLAKAREEGLPLSAEDLIAEPIP